MKHIVTFIASFLVVLSMYGQSKIVTRKHNVTPKMTSKKTTPKKIKVATSNSLKRNQQQETQEAVFFRVNGQTLSEEYIPSSGVVHSYTIETNEDGDVDISGVPNWARVSKVSYREFKIEFDANNTVSSRSCLLYFLLNGRKVEVNLIQDAVPIEVVASFEDISVHHNEKQWAYSQISQWYLLMGIQGWIKTSGKGASKVPLRVVAYFTDEHGQKIKSYYSYKNVDDDKNFCVSYDYSPYSDSARSYLSLTVPNEGFYLSLGKKHIYCHLYVIRLDNNNILCQTKFPFTLEVKEKRNLNKTKKGWK